ncbi:hypothetical protein [Stakelama saccharophila]|uniref:Lipoprotein n=1 Tax=Stakelama saccharophila TaxID=3075605 RepID=A0ABZ0BCI7_9SPHN|nr:hypothetical protein [Stakelama sp. W311]WNO55063.1 hypothetical protein RPR59_07415 [Stakelama sp. W311]
MQRSITAIAGLALLAGCNSSGADQQAAAAKPEKPDCTSVDVQPTYNGFSSAAIADLADKRVQMMQAGGSDAAAWDEGAKTFATYFLDQIGMKPDALCPGNYKAIQTLMGAEMDFESRAPDKAVLPEDKTADYIRILYSTAGLSEDRGEDALDTKVQQTMEGVARTRESWNK